MVTISIGYCALPAPIKRTQSVGVNHFPLGIAMTMAQDNYKVQFKEELYKRSQICQKHLIPKVEYFNTIPELCHRNYSTARGQTGENPPPREFLSQHFSRSLISDTCNFGGLHNMMWFHFDLVMVKCHTFIH